MSEERPEVLLLARRAELRLNTRALVPLMDRLEDRGLRTRLVCLEASSASDPERIVVKPGLSNRWLRPLRLRGLWRELKPQRPEILHVLDQDLADLGLELAEIAGIPYVLTISNYSILETGLRISRRLCRRLIVTGPELATDIVRQLGVPEQLVSFVPPGIEVELGPPHEHRADGARVIGTMRTSDERGLDQFLQAARLILDRGLDAEFVVAGSGHHLDPIRPRLDSLGLASRVTFAENPVASFEISRIFDVFCDPGGDDSPHLGLLNAFAHAIPTVAIQSRGVAHFVQHEVNGLLAPPGDPFTLADSIARLLDEPDFAQTLRLNAQRLTQLDFHPETEADRLSSIYQEVLNSQAAENDGTPANQAIAQQIPQSTPFPQ